jgi:hypothetical protein
LRQTEPRTQTTLAARHLPFVGFMIVTGQMEQAMKNEYLNFRGERVSLLNRLAPGGGHTDRQVAGNLLRAFRQCAGGKREHVGRLVDAAVLAIEPADLSISGKQYAHLASQTDRRLRLS